MEVFIFIFEFEGLLFVFGEYDDFIVEFGRGFNFLGQVDLAFAELQELVFFGLGEIEDGVDVGGVFEVVVEELRFVEELLEDEFAVLGFLCHERDDKKMQQDWVIKLLFIFLISKSINQLFFKSLMHQLIDYQSFSK